ncbi:DUF397 domain-containing protein [Streptomyces sp. NPDC007905]|uniref:DUF397 domain-containing protein n=1 Tax=Streptomyces sp. NPDC007905 TaxID=3364788 RepID=UPI0036EAF00C
MRFYFNDALWRKSSACGDGASCLEVARSGSAVGVRDARGVGLVFSELAWHKFISAKFYTAPGMTDACEC